MLRVLPHEFVPRRHEVKISTAGAEALGGATEQQLSGPTATGGLMDVEPRCSMDVEPSSGFENMVVSPGYR